MKRTMVKLFVTFLNGVVKASGGVKKPYRDRSVGLKGSVAP